MNCQTFQPHPDSEALVKMLFILHHLYVMFILAIIQLKRLFLRLK